MKEMKRYSELTDFEMEFLNAMRNNSYSDLLETNYEWLFAVTDECSYTEKQATGVISSLKKKGLINTAFDKGEKLHIVGFTSKGKSLFDDADGEECAWGGKPLLKR